MTEKKQRAPRRISPTSLDVAREAGVSQAAVSYALNGVSQAHVSDETRAKILQAARKLGYHAHPSARSLRKGQSDEICCIIDAPSTLLAYEIHISIMQQIFQHGYIPVFYVSPSVPTGQWRETLRGIFARRPMGLIMSQFTSMADEISLARQMGIENIVLISPRPVEDIPAVIFPSSTPGYLAARHLLERGHRHLALVHPRDPIMQGVFQERLEGMRAAIGEMPDVALDCLPLAPTLTDAYALVDTNLMGAEHPTGIYAFNDDYALPLLRALADRGVQVPQEIAVAGTDDLPFCEFVRPSLTSIRYDSEDAIGQRVVEMLISLQTGQLLQANYTHTLTPQLIPREST